MSPENSNDARVRALLQQGEQYKQEGKLAQAEASIRNALQLAPNHPEALYRLAMIAYAAGRIGDALPILERAAALLPGNPHIELARGAALEAQGRWEEALACYRQVSERYPDAQGPYDAIGNTLMGCGRVEEAIASYRAAIERQPEFAEAWLHLGRALAMNGDIAGAEQAYDRVLALQPDNLEIYRLKALLRRHRSRDESDAETMERYLSDPKLPPLKAMHLHYALGKIYDELGEYETAYPHFLEANRLRRADNPYDAERDIETLNRIRSLFTRDFFTQRSDFGLTTERPIFIVGMPRSGSTLVEQILSAHPEVAAAGEVPDFWKTISTVGPFPELAEKVDSASSIQLAENYLERMQVYNHGGRPRMTDKNLLSFLYIGMIRLLFPNAKVICCRRDPMETCFSIWMRYFPAINSLAADQYEVGRIYRVFESMMNHWNDVLPGFVLDFEHRALIEDQEAQTRRLLAFCELDWSDDCLRFHDSGRAAMTASTTQVRQPLNDRGIGHWRHYAHHLGEMQRALNEPLP